MNKTFKKRILLSILCFSMSTALIVNPTYTKAVEPIITHPTIHQPMPKPMDVEKTIDLNNLNSIGNNSIRLHTTHVVNIFQSFWTDFGFYKMPDETYRLKYLSNGQFYNPDQVRGDHVLYLSVEFRFIDNNQDTYRTFRFPSGTQLRYISSQLEQVKLRAGLDKVQIIVADGAGRNTAIGGYVHNNLTNSNFGDKIDYYHKTDVAFRVEHDGLYAEYINQHRIPDGKYIIQPYKDTSKALTAISGNRSIKVSNKNLNNLQQQFNITYDNVKKAYRIKNIYTNEYLSWTSSKGNDVIHFTGGNYNDQFWYFKEKGTSGTYNVRNANDFMKFLNLDSNGYNISVASERGNTNQQFVFTKIN